MKVLIISKSDAQGGAYIAAYRLHVALRRIGVGSKMLVDDKLTDDIDVIGWDRQISKSWGKIRSFIDKLPVRLYNWEMLDFHPAWVGRKLSGHELVRNADVINLHWTLRGFLSIKEIAKLAKLNKPIVWTLHDMWACTGGCHYSGDCVRYKTKCGACPKLRSRKKKDLAYKVFRKKSKYFSDIDLNIVVLCNWMQDCVKGSSLLSGRPVHMIPNGLDTDVFKPIEKSIARDRLNLPLNKRIVLFGALSRGNSERKGFKYLKKAIDSLAKRNDFRSEELCILVFGTSDSKDVGDFPFGTRCLGTVYDDSSMAVTYNAADVFVAPSLEDNFPNTVLESVSCGTPVVAFNTGGIPDMIEHKVTGYLSRPRDSDSLSIGIKWALVDSDRALELRQASREKALRQYRLEIQAGRYKTLFDSLA